MPSGWDVYYVVFLSAALALTIPLGLALFSLLILSRGRRGKGKVVRAPATQFNGSISGKKINTRFFLAANAALILITIVLVLVPCVATLQPGNTREQLVRTLISIVSIAGFAAIGLLYSAKKGDLGWLRSFRHDGKGD